MTRRARPPARERAAPAHRPPMPQRSRHAPRPHPGLTLSVLACTGVVTSMLSPSSALALGLGELRVESALGETLRATVPVDLAPGEFAGSSCVSAINASDPNLRTVPAARVQLPESATPGLLTLQIMTTAPLFEPMYALALQVRCPGTPLVVRQYVLMLDLPGAGGLTAAAAPVPVAGPVTGAVTASAPATPGAAAQPALPGETPAPPARDRSAGARLAHSSEPIVTGVAYRVREGDTLSGIAARVAARGSSATRDVAERIYAANPAAFIHGNRDLIKLGSEIVVPDATVVTTTAPVSVAAPAPLTPAVTAAAPAATQPQPGAAPAAARVAPAVTPAATAAVTAAAPAPPKVFADELPAPAARPTPLPRAATHPPTAASRSHPVLSALAGLLLGLVASIALMRQRLMDGLARLLRRRPVEEVAAPMARTAPAPVVPVHPRRLRAPDSMVVEESRAAEDILGFDDDITSPQAALPPDMAATLEEPVARRQDGLSPTATMAALPAADLGSLFDDPAVTAELPGTGTVRSHNAEDGATVAARGSGNSAALDLDLTNAMDAAGATLPVEDIGWLGDNADDTQTRRSLPTQADADAADPSEMGLDALALGDSADDKLSATLREALDLLERDYEDEFSATQAASMRDRKPGTADAPTAPLKDAWGTTRAEDPDDPDATLSRTGTDRHHR